MIAVVLMGFLVLGMVAAHMARSRFQRIPRVSAARFFQGLPPPRDVPRLRVANPLRSVPFYLRLAAALVLFFAVLSQWMPLVPGEAWRMGIWLIVDTSGSMSTVQAGGSRHDAAQRAAAEVTRQAQGAGRDVALCWRVSAFDLELRHELITEQSLAALEAVADFTPRALGTDMSVLRSVLPDLKETAAAECPITHLVVLTDQSIPDWMTAEARVPVIWLPIGEQVENVGFSQIRIRRHPLTGLVDAVGLELMSYGRATSGVRLSVIAPDGTAYEIPAVWQLDGSWSEEITPVAAGQYAFRVSPGGSYGYDDEVRIEVADAGPIRVDWRLSDRTWLEKLLAAGAWVEDRATPQLRITDTVSASDGVPELIVGVGYEGEPSEIWDFYEPSQLLADLNLDVAETVGMVGQIVPQDFTPVLRAMGGPEAEQAWLAQRDLPLAAIIPGLPKISGEREQEFSTTVFFNAVRWLLQSRALPPLYELTSPEAPEPGGTRLALHDGEGDTTRLAQGVGAIDDLVPVIIGRHGRPLWPLLLTIAAALFLVERSLAAWRGYRWI